MIVGEQVRELLLAHPPVVAQVIGRVFPQALPQGVVLPAIRYQVVSDIPQNSLGGFTSALRNARVQVDVFARKYLEAHAVADAVAGALGSVVGEVSSTLIARRDGYEDETGMHRVSMDFSMWMEA